MDDFSVNPLRIVEGDFDVNVDMEKSSTSDNEDKETAHCELFDFSVSDIEELNSSTTKVTTTSAPKRNSLLIVEDKDLIIMDDNNNNSENIHRLSLQVESGNSDSLVMTNEAINRTIIRIGGIDFGELNDEKTNNNNINENQSPSPQQEAINHEIEENDIVNERSPSQSGDDNESSEAIVNILGQINEIVGYFLCLCKNIMLGIIRTLVMAIIYVLIILTIFTLSLSHFFTVYLLSKNFLLSNSDSRK